MLICFDMDNTLVHSDKAHALAFQKALVKLGFPRLRFLDIAKHFGKPKMEVAKAISGSNDKKVLLKILQIHDYWLYKDTKKYCTKIKGVLSVLKKLKEKHKLIVASNCKHKSIEIILDAADLDYRLFDLIIGSDDVKHSKPYPDEIFLAKKLLHHKVDYMIGDSIYDIRAGKKAKVKTVAVLSGLYSKGELEKEKPDFVINRLKGLLKVI